jgi:hypothetical protein
MLGYAGPELELTWKELAFLRDNDGERQEFHRKELITQRGAGGSEVERGRGREMRTRFGVCL